MIKSQFILIVFLLTFFTISVNGQTVKDKIITIDPHLSFQNYEHFKRLTLSSPNSSIEYLEDFDFAWGYKYQLNVRETELDEWLSDGTQFDYALNKIVSKTKMPDSTEFRLTIDPNRYYYKLDSTEQHMNATLKQINDSTYFYFEEVNIEIPANLKDKFDVILKDGISKRGKFVYVNDKLIRLIHL